MSEWLIAQAVVEHGLLDSIASGIARLRYELDGYLGRGSSTYILIGAVVLLLLIVVRRRR